jgi:hypothetical protein
MMVYSLLYLADCAVGRVAQPMEVSPPKGADDSVGRYMEKLGVGEARGSDGGAGGTSTILLCRWKGFGFAFFSVLSD